VSDTCFIPVSRIQAAGAVCQPATGIMTAYLKNDPPLTSEKRAAIMSGIKRLVRFGMTEDIYVGNNCRHLSFIGTRTGEGNFDSFREPKPVGLQGTPSENVNNPNRTAGIIGGLAGLFLLVAIAVFFVGGAKREEPKLDQDTVDVIVTSERSDGSKQKNEEVINSNP
jgi:hypothetical protein